MDAAARGPIELGKGHASDRDVVPAGQIHDVRQTPAAALADAKRSHASGLEGLEHGIEPVDQHLSAATNARARSRLPWIGGIPALAGSSAPRSIAGTARSSSGPSARPVRT